MGCGLRTKWSLSFRLKGDTLSFRWSAVQTCSHAISALGLLPGPCYRAQHVYSTMGKLKDVIFLREVNSLKFIIVHKSKEAHLEGGKGPVRAAFPQLTRRMEKSAVCHLSALYGGGHLKQGLSLSGALSTATHLTTSSSLIVHHQPSFQVSPPQNTQNPSLKAQSSESPLPRQVILEPR